MSVRLGTGESRLFVEQGRFMNRPYGVKGGGEISATEPADGVVLLALEDHERGEAGLRGESLP